MPTDGSGNYSLPSPPTFPAVAGTTISSSYYNAVMNDIATALNNAFYKDGQAIATGDFNLNSYAIHNLLDPSSAQDAATKNYVDASDVAAKAAVLATLAASGGAALIGAALGGTVEDTIAVVTPEQLGMTTAASDNSAALSNALSALSGRVLDGRGRTYKLGTVLNKTMSVGVKMRNITFDCSSIATGGVALEIWGSSGTQRTLTADIAAGGYIMQVDSTTGFTAGGIARITSLINMAASGTAYLGQMVRVKSVDSSTQLTLSDPLLYSFTTAGSTKITPLTMPEGDYFENVKFIGHDSGHQGAFRLGYRYRPVLNQVSTDLFDYFGVELNADWHPLVLGGHLTRAHEAGYAYGIVVNGGCRGVNVIGTTFEDVRHGVTVGGSTCTNTFVTVIGTHGREVTNAGLDSHVGGDYITFANNTVEMAAVLSGTADGMISQGPNFVCVGNTITSPGGILISGIRHQMLAANVPLASSNVSGNTVTNLGGTVSTDVGITQQHQGNSGVPMGPVVCNGNVINGGLEIGIYIRGTSGPLRDIVCSGNSVNVSVASQGILLRAESASNIDRAAITSNVLNCVGTGQNILLLTDSTGVISNVMIHGNVCSAGNYGISFSGTNANTITKVEIGRNQYDNVTKSVNWTTALAAVNLDRGPFTAKSVTASTYTVLEEDEFLTFDTSATCTVTLPSAANHKGRTFYLRNVQAQNIVSASSNVVPVASKTAGTLILANFAGVNTILKSDGTNWISFSAY